MDAAAYLKAQGWQGDGHSLDRTGRGIKKPLLVSKKVDVLGLGIKKHTATSDQWWLRAFDTSLRDLGTGKKSALAQIRETGVNRGGLYGFFVKGEGLEGSIAAAVSADDEASKLSKEEIKRKRDEEKEQKKAARAERAAIRKAAEEAKERAKQERREAK
ncbi:hypothetical protein M501DRAFT_906860, partial [Patellaria atrata CBS 101060]